MTAPCPFAPAHRRPGRRRRSGRGLARAGVGRRTPAADRPRVRRLRPGRRRARAPGTLVGRRGSWARTSRTGPPRRPSAAAIVAGEVPVDRVSERGPDAQPIDVPDGLINHWRGAILVPRANLDQVLAELRSPQTRRHVQDDVLESRVLWRRGDESQIFLKLMRKKIVTVTYNTEHHVRYVRLSPTTASSQSVSTRIAEVDNAGTPGGAREAGGRGPRLHVAAPLLLALPAGARRRDHRTRVADAQPRHPGRRQVRRRADHRRHRPRVDDAHARVRARVACWPQAPAGPARRLEATRR